MRRHVPAEDIIAHAYSNILKILPPDKTKIFRQKNSDIFLISAQNIDWGYSVEPLRRGGSNEYPQSMFLSRNKKNNVYPCKPQFYYIKVEFKGSKLYRHIFVMYLRKGKSLITLCGCCPHLPADTFSHSAAHTRTIFCKSCGMINICTRFTFYFRSRKTNTCRLEDIQEKPQSQNIAYMHE